MQHEYFDNKKNQVYYNKEQNMQNPEISLTVYDG